MNDEEYTKYQGNGEVKIRTMLSRWVLTRPRSWSGGIPCVEEEDRRPRKEEQGYTTKTKRIG